MKPPVQVMKFGGSSFADASRFGPVVRWIVERAKETPVVCVVSAPSGLTERYRETLLEFNAKPSDALVDALLPLADSVGACLLAAALQANGLQAAAAPGRLTGLRTDANPTRARLLSVDLAPLHGLLAHHRVVVVPGGQGSAEVDGRTTWLGKNSSDLTAVALAAALGCPEVAIHSDVPGVYSSDPTVVPQARVLQSLGHAQAIRMSLLGAKVLHHRAVQHALEQGLRIVCRANRGSFEMGTVLEPDGPWQGAVVPDARSRVFEGEGSVVASAVDALEAVDVPCLRLPAAQAALQRLVVTCGFFDAEHFLLQRHQLPLRPLDLRLLSAMTGAEQEQHELVSPGLLTQRAAQWHGLLTKHPEPLGERLAPFVSTRLSAEHV
jgi:aspartate kinase